MFVFEFLNPPLFSVFVFEEGGQGQRRFRVFLSASATSAKQNSNEAVSLIVAWAVAFKASVGLCVCLCQRPYAHKGACR